ncbi:MAG: 50S ribosomal protein L25 [Bacteroidales bacterium]|nr:50S ribosomal protein L25 [Bacteroidales bacterium]
MNSVSLSGSLRENVGKKDAKKLRAQGLVPCIIYGNGREVRFYTEEKSFKTILFTPETYIIDFTIDGQVYRTILQDVQYHPISDEVLHADFLEVTEEKPITVTLPVRTEGTSPGVMRGGKLKVRIPRLKVKGLIKDLPAIVMVNISELNVNQAIRVKDINIENVTPLVAANNIVCDVKAKKSAVTEEETEE